MKEFAFELLRQLFGYTKARQGKLILTRTCLSRMNEYGIDESTVRDVFRNGQEKKPGMIIQYYYEYAVGILYKYDPVGHKYLITTCWKGGGK